MKKIYLLVAGLVAGGLVNAQSIEQDGHQYQIVQSDQISWDMANEMAKSYGEGWHLVTITSAKEQKIVQELLKDQNTEYWLGAYKDAANQWAWVSGEEFGFTNWGTGEPNNFLERSEQHIGMWSRINWSWNDEGFLPHIGGFVIEHDGEDHATGILDVDKADLSIYPNPNKGAFTVSLNTEASGNVQLSVLNVVGSVVHTENLNATGSSLRQDLDLSELAPGAYWVKVSSGKSSLTKKVVITQ